MRPAGRWPRALRATLRLLAFLAVLGPGKVVRADDSAPANSPPPSTTVTLEYREAGYTVANWYVSVEPRSAPFLKEPPTISGTVFRGLLNFGGSSNSIPFLWQRNAGKLYLDLNRNQDLSDGSATVFSARKAGPVQNQQTFPDVRLAFNAPSGRTSVLADLTFYSANPTPYCYAALRSFWQGKVSLHGRDWQVGLVPDSPNAAASIENGRLLLRPWQEPDKAFNAQSGSLDTIPFSRKLFVDGHAYELACLTAPQNGAVKPALQFTEQSVPLGEVTFTGQYIKRLILPGGVCQVVLDQPVGTVKIPVGHYYLPNVTLEKGGVAAICNVAQRPMGNRISVDGTTPALVAAGGPLTNTVAVSREGEDLVLNYRLIGAGGESCQLVNRDFAHPPEFAIYQGEKKIASGKFEFG